MVISLLKKNSDAFSIFFYGMHNIFQKTSVKRISIIVFKKVFTLLNSLLVHPSKNNINKFITCHGKK